MTWRCEGARRASGLKPEPKPEPAWFLRRRVHGAKVAVLCHSMGGSVWLYFQQWLLSPHGAALSAAWLDEYVERVVLIGAPLLGTPKVIAGMLMGEGRHTLTNPNSP